jgi:phosphonate transport system permease protein
MNMPSTIFMGQKHMNSLLPKKITPTQFLRKQKLYLTLTLLGFGIIIIGASTITNFSLIDSFSAIPKVVEWMFTNLFPNAKALSRLPRILDKLMDTILMSIMASVTASIFAFIFALLGSRTTRPNSIMAVISRGIASINRNIPIAGWAMIFLLAFGQSSFTGFLALFFATFGFLTRAFMETIDEASSHPVKALRAAGASELQLIFQAVLPESMPQMLSWVLYMIETNIRSATLVGLLTGSGIGFMFSIYYKSLQYHSASLVVLSIVAVVLIIEVVSNILRRIIL